MSNRVLNEEKKDAEKAAFPLLMGAGCSAAIGALLAAACIVGAWQAAPAAAVCWLATTFCMLWFWRTRRVLARWREQERIRLDLHEMEEDLRKERR